MNADILVGIIKRVCEIKSNGSDRRIPANANTDADFQIVVCFVESVADICERSGQDLTFNIGTLNADESYVFTWRARIADPATTPPAPAP